MPVFDGSVNKSENSLYYMPTDNAEIHSNHLLLEFLNLFLDGPLPTSGYP